MSREDLAERSSQEYSSGVKRTVRQSHEDELFLGPDSDNNSGRGSERGSGRGSLKGNGYNESKGKISGVSTGSPRTNSTIVGGRSVSIFGNNNNNTNTTTTNSHPTHSTHNTHTDRETNTLYEETRNSTDSTDKDKDKENNLSVQQTVLQHVHSQLQLRSPRAGNYSSTSTSSFSDPRVLPPKINLIVDNVSNNSDKDHNESVRESVRESVLSYNSNRNNEDKNSSSNSNSNKNKNDKQEKNNFDYIENSSIRSKNENQSVVSISTSKTTSFKEPSPATPTQGKILFFVFDHIKCTIGPNASFNFIFRLLFHLFLICFSINFLISSSLGFLIYF